MLSKLQFIWQLSNVLKFNSCIYYGCNWNILIANMIRKLNCVKNPPGMFRAYKKSLQVTSLRQVISKLCECSTTIPSGFLHSYIDRKWILHIFSDFTLSIAAPVFQPSLLFRAPSTHLMSCPFNWKWKLKFWGLYKGSIWPVRSIVILRLLYGLVNF